MSISEMLNSARVPKITRSLKFEKTIFRETFNPSTCLPGQTLYIQIPKLQENVLIIPKSTFLCFEIEQEKCHADNYLVQNLSKHLIQNMKISFGNKILLDLDRYDIFYGYHDLLMKEEDQMLGIMSEEKRKIRSKGAGDAKFLNQTHVTYGNNYDIPLSCEILDLHGCFYPFLRLKYKILNPLL